MKQWLFLLLITLLSCSRTQLIDQEQVKFSALATQGDYPDKVEITWSLNPYYKSYQIFRATGEFIGDHVPISSLIKGNSFVDYNTIPGQNYYYHVVAYNHSGAAIFQTDSVLGYGGISTILPPKNINSIKAISSDEIRITWDSVPQATAYAIYRRISGQDNYVSVGQTDFPYYSDTTALPGILYQYRIASIDTSSFEGALSAPVEGLRFGISDNIFATDGQFDDQIALSWDSVLCVQSYNIYRSVNEKIPQFIANTSSDIYIDKDVSLKHGQLYYYWVEAVAKSSDMAVSPKSRAETGYKRSSSAPNQSPQMNSTQIASVQGMEKNKISLAWQSVDNALSYDVYRSESIKGNYEKIATVTTTTYQDNPPANNYTYFYTLVALNGTENGPRSNPIEAWTLKAPYHIQGSRFYSDKIMLTWDSVPQAKSYNVYDAINGTKIATVTTNIFTEKILLGSQNMISKYYKVSVINKNDTESDLSQSITAIAQKMPTPSNFKILNNKTDSEKFLSLSWDSVEGAEKYRIYRATYKHRFESRDDAEQRFTLLTELDSYVKFYRDPLTKFPLRRYLYKMVAVDPSGKESEPTDIIEAYRYPNDINEFIRDVDYNIYFTQVQIDRFGWMGLESKVNGRGGGYYDYASKMDSIRNNWRQLTQFEITLHGDTKMGIILTPMGSSMNGPIDVSGLYTGAIEYIGLQALDGGTVANGSIKASYNHPSQGTLTTTRTVSELNALMITIRVGDDPPYVKPNPDDYLP
ncbi:MAG: hypothetical protein ACRCV0_06560 [Brevinema sp.]